MKNKLVRLRNLSGDAASVYSIYYSDKDAVLFEKFVKDNMRHSPEEVMDIVRRLRSIGTITGAEESYFKLDEGLIWDDAVCALYDIPEKHLRLYCILVSEKILIIGSGGFKSKDIRKWQEDPQLTSAVHEMMHFSAIIKAKFEHGSLYISDDDLKFEGDLTLVH